MLPSEIKLTPPPITIATTTTMYKASTLRLRSYKAYIRMISIAILEGKYHQDRFIGFRNHWAYQQRRSESQRLGIGETIASGDSYTKIELDFIAIFERQRWLNTNIYEGACQCLSTAHPDVRLGRGN